MAVSADSTQLMALKRIAALMDQQAPTLTYDEPMGLTNFSRHVDEVTAGQTAAYRGSQRRRSLTGSESACQHDPVGVGTGTVVANAPAIRGLGE